MLFKIQDKIYALLSFKLENKRIENTLTTSLTLYTHIIGEKKQHLTFSALYEDEESSKRINQIFTELEQAILTKQDQIDLTSTIDQALEEGFIYRSKENKEYPQIYVVLEEAQPQTEQGTFVKFTEPTKSSPTKHYVYLNESNFDIRPEMISAPVDTYYTIRFLGNPDYIPCIEVTLNRYRKSYQQESSSIEYWYKNTLRNLLTEALKTEDCIDLEEAIQNRFPSQACKDVFTKPLTYRDFTTKLKESKYFTNIL